jgi:hypothetical protein
VFDSMAKRQASSYRRQRAAEVREPVAACALQAARRGSSGLLREHLDRREAKRRL